VKSISPGYFLLATLLLLTSCQAATASTPGATPQASFLPGILPPPGEAGSFLPTRCRFVLPEDLHEGEDVECGYLTVQEQREQTGTPPNERLIQIAVSIFHPPGGAIQPDPVIYLSGGPGASVLEVIRYQHDVYTEPVFATGRDLVLFDQRGVGISRPALDCPALDELGRELLDRELNGRLVSQEEAVKLYLENLEACRQELAQVADLSAYNSTASAADINDLRLALGYPQVNLWGGSYGTRLALEVMRRYPQGLRSVVLDAVYPPDVDLYLEAPANFQRALERLFEACGTNVVCNAAYPDLREVFFATIRQLNENPARREVEDPFRDETYTTVLDGDTLMGLTFQLLYDSKLRYLLPKQIYAAGQGDYTAFDRARLSMLRLADISSRGMMFSVQCHEELAFSSYKDFLAMLEVYPEVSALFTNSILGGMAYQACDLWGAGEAGPSAGQPVHSDIPTLVMTGEFDPVTPPAWGKHASDTLENAYTFEYPGAGHGASGLTGCPRQMLVAFLEQPEAAPDDVCIADMANP
jgi:pimeloyl-ACP methyl ester carboxylesterase